MQILSVSSHTGHAVWCCVSIWMMKCLDKTVATLKGSDDFWRVNFYLVFLIFLCYSFPFFVDFRKQNVWHHYLFVFVRQTFYFIGFSYWFWGLEREFFFFFVGRPPHHELSLTLSLFVKFSQTWEFLFDFCFCFFLRPSAPFSSMTLCVYIMRPWRVTHGFCIFFPTTTTIDSHFATK